MKRIYKIILASILFLSFSVAIASEKDSETWLVNLLLEKYNLSTETYVVEVILNPFENQKFLPEKVKLIVLTQRKPLGLFSVKIEYYEDDKKLSKQVKYRIIQYENILIINDLVKVKTLVNKEMFHFEKTDVTRLMERPIYDFKEISGLRAKRNLRRGKILTTASLEKVPDIIWGNNLSIIYGSGSFTISADGIALQDGSIGEIIKVKNVQSKKILRGRISKKGVVRIE